MDSRQLIDSQFNRAVEIVQGLPKTGPIQTDYEEKLTMYSLYKQATVGNVHPPRPSVWDMLGRAKWDAWSKHKNLDQLEAKWLYVDALLKVLRKYSDKTVAKDLVQELESYNIDASHFVASGSTPRSPSSSSSGSSTSAADLSTSRHPAVLPSHLRNNQLSQSNPIPIPQLVPTPHQPQEVSSSDGEDEEDGTEEEDEVPLALSSAYGHAALERPGSSISSHRYRTPMASMMMTPPGLGIGVPATQPMPNFETPSAFEGGSSSPIHSYPTSSMSYPENHSQPSRTDVMSPPNVYQSQAVFRGVGQRSVRPYALQSGMQPRGMTPRPSSRPVLERALENVQAHLAALTERIESLEGLVHRSTTSFATQSGARSPGWAGAGRGSPAGRRGDEEPWNLDDMGMWSILLNPLSRMTALFQTLMTFLASNENHSPTMVIIRRLFLDISFLLFVLAIARSTWRRSGMRRREVLNALGGLWRALLGQRRPRVLMDRGV